MPVYRIALLLCDVPLPPVQEVFGTYHNVFNTWLQSSLATYQSRIGGECDLIVDGYNVVQERTFPSWQSLTNGTPDKYDAVMISGSRHTAHELDPPFIPELIDWVRTLCTDDAYSDTKVVGICFGHQIINIAMGGTCERGDKGWEIGVYGARITEEGRAWFSDGSEIDKVFLEQMHRDVASTIPPSFTITLSTEKYPVQGMVMHHPLSTPLHPFARVFTVQGHPEFTPELVEMMVRYRIDGKIIDEATGREALARVWGKNRQGGEGLVRVGWSFWKMLLGRPEQ